MADKRPFFLISDRARACLAAALVALMLAVAHVFPAAAGDAPPSFTLDLHDSNMDLAAEDAPLPEILAAIAHKAGVTLRSAEQATELISCRLSSVSLEEGLEKLLGNWNYALLYRKDSQGRSVPDTLWVISRNPHRQTSGMNVRPSLVPIEEKNQPRQDHLKKYRKEDIAAVFAESKKILLGIDAKTIDVEEFMDPDQSPLPPLSEEEEREGIKITRLSRTSPLSLIGLQEGDLIMDVNGNPVGSAADLVRNLSIPPEEVSVIRIERWRNGKIDPLYLELQ